MSTERKVGRRAMGGLMTRIIITVVTLAGFLAGSLVYIAFFAQGYNFLQQFVVFVVSFIVALTIIAIVWLTWAGRRGVWRGMMGPWDEQ